MPISHLKIYVHTRSYCVPNFGVPNFYYNIKCSPLKLLCTIAYLCKGTPHQPLRIKFSRINFPSHPRSKLQFIPFCRQNNRTRGKTHRSHDCASLTNLITPETSIPTSSPNYPLPRHAVLFCVIARRWRNVYFALHTIFSLCTHPVLPLIFTRSAPVIPPTSRR